MPVLIAVVLLLVVKAVLVEKMVVAKVLTSVEVDTVDSVMVSVGTFVSSSMVDVVVVFDCVEGFESPTAQPEVVDNM
jgi:hypothetical protein